MKVALSKLINVLKKQKELYEKLLELGLHKQRDLVEGKIEAVEEATNKEEIMLGQAVSLEEERLQCTMEVAAGYDLQDGTFLEIIEASPPGERQELKQLYNEMKELIRKMDKLNQENMNLIQQSLRFIDVTMDVITQQRNNTYGNDHEMKSQQLNRIVDKKI